MVITAANLPATAPQGINILFQDTHAEGREFINGDWIAYDSQGRSKWF